jgi:hypothetical protein
LGERIRGELLETALKDNAKARVLTPSGLYARQRVRKGVPVRRSQNEFIKAAQGAIVTRPSTGSGKAQFQRFKLAPRPFAGKPG